MFYITLSIFSSICINVENFKCSEIFVEKISKRNICFGYVLIQQHSDLNWHSGKRRCLLKGYSTNKIKHKTLIYNIYNLQYTNSSKWVKFQKLKILQSVPKRIRLFILNITVTKYSIFKSFFFSWKLRSVHTFSIQNYFCAIKGGWNIHKRKWGSGTDSFMFTLSHATSKPHKLAPGSPSGPRLAI